MSSAFHWMLPFERLPGRAAEQHLASYGLCYTGVAERRALTISRSDLRGSILFHGCLLGRSLLQAC